MTTTVITTVSADDCDEWTDAVISNCFKSLNATEDPARGNDTELALKQALTAFYVEYYTPRDCFDGVFTDFDYNYKPYLEQLGHGWVVGSYRNDTCPRVDYDLPGFKGYTVWFDYKDPKLSEHTEQRLDGTMHQFCLANENGEVFMSSNDFNDILEKAKTIEVIR